MIIRGSRYALGTTVRIKQADGTNAVAVYVDRQLSVAPMDYVPHTVMEGERLEHIAAVAYGNGQLWWLIARANPQLFYPDQIPAGTIVRVPTANAVR